MHPLQLRETFYQEYSRDYDNFNQDENVSIVPHTFINDVFTDINEPDYNHFHLIQLH